MDPRRRAYLKAMEIDVWVPRARADPPALGDPPGIAGATPDVGSEDAAWDALALEVSQCTRCELASTRNRTVFGIGSSHADWLIVGEAPGAEEDRLGEPFVGRAGQLLNAMLASIGLSREQVFIANILKCRPPRNRDPAAAEITECRAYLDRQIAHIRPKIILAVGRVAAQNLLESSSSLGKLRGRRLSYGEHKVPMVVTYHPAYLLRSPREKSKAWRDLLLARSIYRELL